MNIKDNITKEVTMNLLERKEVTSTFGQDGIKRANVMFILPLEQEENRHNIWKQQIARHDMRQQRTVMAER